MVSKNNRIKRMEEAAERQSHFGIRKLTVGAASVLLGITLLFGANAKVARAAETNVTTSAGTNVTTSASADKSDNNEEKDTNQGSTDVPVTTPTDEDSNENTTPNNRKSEADNGENEAEVETQNSTQSSRSSVSTGNLTSRERSASDQPVVRKARPVVRKVRLAEVSASKPDTSEQQDEAKKPEKPDWYMTDPSKATDENAARKNLEQAIAYAKANPIKGLDIKGEQDADKDVITVAPDPNKKNEADDANDAITIAYDNEKDSAQYMQSTANKIWDEIKTYEAYEAERETFMDGLAAEGLYNPKTDVDPTTLSQHLTLDSEPDAIVNLEIKNNSGDWITATENGLENGLEKDKLVTEGNDLLTIANGADKSDLDAMGSKRGWTVTFKHNAAVKDPFIRLTFKNLKNSHYDDGTNAVPIDEIVETFSDVRITDGEPAKFIFANDPTRGWWYNHCSGVTATIQLYGEYDKTDKNGSPIKDKDGKVEKEEKLITFNQPVYMSVSSLNSSGGDYKESAQLESDGEAYKIPESSVIADGNKLYSPYYNNWYLDHKEDDYKYWGEKFEPAAWHGAADEQTKVENLGKHIVETYKGWDNPDQYNRIFGSGLYKVNGDRIKVRSYVGGSTENLSISKYNHVWFAYSTIIPETTFDAKHPGTTINYHFAKAINVKTSQTVKFVDDQGNQFKNHKPNTQDGYSFTIKDGKPTEASHTYNDVDVPVIPGYVADKTSLIKDKDGKYVPGPNIIVDKDGGTYVPGQKVTVYNPDVTIEVVYHKVGKIVPVGKDGKEIPGALTPEYKNDPTDPTKVTPDESTPSIPGYHITDNENPGKNPDGTPNNNTVTPQKPTMDTKVVYIKNEETVTVKYYDDDQNDPQDLSSYNKEITGEAGSDLGYSTKPSIDELQNKGYKLVSDSFDAAKLDGKMPAKGGNYEVHFVHDQIPVGPDKPGKPDNPINPNDPDGPKYPKDSDKVSVEVTRTIQYKGLPADNTPKDVTQPAYFTAEGVLDKVTGEWSTPLKWSADQTIVNVVSPKVEGYHVANVSADSTDGTNVDAKTLSHTDKSYIVTVTYVKDKVVPPVEETVTVKYYDDDQNDPQDLSSYDKKITGEAGSNLGYSTKPSIDELQNKGYKLVSDSFDAAKLDGKMPAKGGNYEVHFVHDQIPVGPDKPGKPDNPINPNDPDGPKYPKDSDKVSVEVTRTIQYKGLPADNTPKDVTQPAYFTAEGVLDKVTGEWSTPLKWSADQTIVNVVSPKVEGYHVANVSADSTDGTNVDAKTLSHTDKSYIVTVTYVKDKVVPPVEETVTVKYYDDDQNDPQDLSSYDKKITGEAGSNLGYSTKPSIDELQNKGYKLVSDSFDAAKLDGKMPAKGGNYEVHFVHDQIPVGPDKPGKPDNPINPNDPDGPKYPKDSDKVSVEVTRTIQYKGLPADNTPKDVTQPAYFTAEGVLDKVTGEWSTPLKWSADQTIVNVVSPKVEGYHVANVSADSTDGTNVDAKTLSHTDKSYIVTVTYVKDKVVPPVEETVTVKYYDDDQNDPQDLSSYDKKITGEAGSNLGYSTKPSIDELQNKGYKLVSDSFDAAKLDGKMPAKGGNYEVHFVHDQIPVGPDKPGKPDNPINPNDPDGPKYPKDSDKVSVEVTRTIQYKGLPADNTPKDVTQPAYFTAEGVLDKVTGEWSTPLKWSADQTIVNVVSPKVEGYHVANVSADSTDGTNVDAKTLSHTDKSYIVTVTYVKDKVVPPVEETVTVKYYDDDQNDPQDLSSYDKKITGEAGSNLGYSTKPSIDELQNKGYKLVSDSFDAAKLDGKMPAKGGNYEVHFVHDQIPVGPDKPGKPDNPINPNDPDGPKYPKDSDKVSVEVTRTIQYKGLPADNTPKDVTQPAYFTAEGVLDKVTGEWSTPLKWSADQTIVNVVSPKVEGYHVANVSADSTDGTNVDAKTLSHTDKSYIVTVTYVKDKVVPPVEETVTVKYYDDDQNDPQDLSSYDKKITGEAGSNLGYSTKPSIDELQNKGYKLVSDSFDAAKLDGKMPAKGGNYEVHFVHGTITVTLTKDSTQTIIYHYSDGSKPDEKKTETHEDTFTRTKVVDKVTGEVIKTTPWTGSHTFDSKDVPVVNGYHSDKKTVGGKTATVNNPDVTDTVTYTPNGKIIPVDPSGNPIPNVPNPTYPTDPNDPTKVVPNEPVPDVPGRTPEVSTVTPEDPSQDTPVVYNPIPNVPGPSDNTPTPVTPAPGKTTEEKKPDENKDDKDVDEPDDDEDVVPTLRHHKKHNGSGSSTTRPRPTGYTPAPRGSSYLDANGKVHYKLPQTGESDSEEMAAVLGGAAATIGLIGLAGAKKRRHE